MKPTYIAALFVFMTGGCAPGAGRIDTLSRVNVNRVKTIAIAPVLGEGPMRAPLLQRVIARLAEGGARAVDLQSTDSVLAGSQIGPDAASDPRLLAEIRNATSADAVLILTPDADRGAIDVRVIGLSSGDFLLHASARSRAGPFKSADAAASSVVRALSTIMAGSARVNAAGLSDVDEIPAP